MICWVEMTRLCCSGVAKPKSRPFDQTVELLKREPTLRTLEKITVACFLVFYLTLPAKQRSGNCPVCSALVIIISSDDEQKLIFMMTNESIAGALVSHLMDDHHIQ